MKTYLSSQGGRVSWERALELLVPVMKALTQVHAQNILHRDISPDNICITPGGESRLLDFGAARFAVGDGKSVSVILKHGYAPEEQYSSHGNQGPWTDVYAMGATLYRCITGVLPPDAVERMHGDTLKAPSKLGIAVPENVEKAVLKALSVRIEDRFRDMDSFIAALTSPAQEMCIRDSPMHIRICFRRCLRQRVAGRHRSRHSQNSQGKNTVSLHNYKPPFF